MAATADYRRARAIILLMAERLHETVSELALLEEYKNLYLICAFCRDTKFSDIKLRKCLLCKMNEQFCEKCFGDPFYEIQACRNTKCNNFEFLYCDCCPRPDVCPACEQPI